jgi:hypothetical protein
MVLIKFPVVGSISIKVLVAGKDEFPVFSVPKSRWAETWGTAKNKPKNNIAAIKPRRRKIIFSPFTKIQIIK